jgi:hypothetical protein
MVPISDDSVKHLSLAPDGPVEHTAPHHALEKEVGFSYQQVLGELVYTYVVGCLDIGYAITFLAHFSLSPTCEHYIALRQVCKYLRHYIDWGILTGALLLVLIFHMFLYQLSLLTQPCRPSRQ